MTINIEQLPRQHKYNPKIKHFVVKIDGIEIGVIEKIPNNPFVARMLRNIDEVGKFSSKEDAAKAIHKAHRQFGGVA